MSIIVRPEHVGEEAAVRAVVDAAFGKPKNSAIVDAIRGTDRWIDGGSIVAVNEPAEIVGHALLSQGDLDLEDGTTRRIWMLGPVAGRELDGRSAIRMDAEDPWHCAIPARVPGFAVSRGKAVPPGISGARGSR